MPQSSKTGTQGLPALLPQLSQQPAEIVQTKPEDNEAQAVSLMRHFGLQVRSAAGAGTFRTLNGTATWEPASTTITLLAGADADMEAAGETLSRLLAPASSHDLSQWLGEMAVMTVSRDKGDTVNRLTITAYARRLSKWPGDVVRDVLEGWPEQNKFWPTWKELNDELQRKSAYRQKLKRAWLRAQMPPLRDVKKEQEQ